MTPSQRKLYFTIILPLLIAFSVMRHFGPPWLAQLGWAVFAIAVFGLVGLVIWAKFFVPRDEDETRIKNP